jgi:hypothetical protein
VVELLLLLVLVLVLLGVHAAGGIRVKAGLRVVLVVGGHDPDERR